MLSKISYALKIMICQKRYSIQIIDRQRYKCNFITDIQLQEICQQLRSEDLTYQLT